MRVTFTLALVVSTQSQKSKDNEEDILAGSTDFELRSAYKIAWVLPMEMHNLNYICWLLFEIKLQQVGHLLHRE